MNNTMQKAGTIARYVLLAMALLCAWWFVYLVQEYDNLWRAGNLVRPALLGISFTLTVLFAAGMFLRPDWRLQLLLVALSTLFAIYALQGILYVASSGNPRAKVAKTLGIPYDARSKSRYIEESNRAGDNVEPAASPTFWVDSNGIDYNGKRILPLAGVARQNQVMCNEDGHWIRFLTDRYGFYNPEEIWKHPIPVALIGDSFVHGVCVDPGDDIAGKMRKRGWRVANLGITGNGPLIELATLTEYARHIRPKLVLWFYFEENDLSDLRHELDSPILQHYLQDKTYSQHLRARQAEIDPAIEHFIMTHRPEYGRALRRLQWIVSFLTMELYGNWLINEAGELSANRLFSEREYRKELQILEEILIKARQETESWGGKMVFVYLPRWSRYAFHEPEDANLRPEVLALARKAGLSVFDFHDTLAAQPDPLAFFPLQLDGHYTPEGHDLLVRELTAWMAKHNLSVGH